MLHALLDEDQPERIAAYLATRHRIDVQRASHDVTALTDHLRAAKLVVSA